MTDVKDTYVKDLHQRTPHSTHSAARVAARGNHFSLIQSRIATPEGLHLDCFGLLDGALEYWLTWTDPYNFHPI